MSNFHKASKETPNKRFHPWEAGAALAEVDVVEPVLSAVVAEGGAAAARDSAPPAAVAVTAVKMEEEAPPLSLL